MPEKLTEPSEDFAATGLTAYNLIEGRYFNRKLPDPDAQEIKRTIQGISDSFSYQADDLGLKSMVSENDSVKITEAVYNGEVLRVQNQSTLVLENKDQSGVYFNRLVYESSKGQFDPFTNSVLPGSSFDEVIGIAVEDIRPFLLKNLDIKHRADMVDGKPTNPTYIQHLTPEKECRVAVIELDIEALGLAVNPKLPNRILVYYDAIDLTGEVIAGTSLSESNVNAGFATYHANGDKGYLVVKKTIPSMSSIYDFTEQTGAEPITNRRPLRDIIMRPYGLGAADPQLSTTALKESTYPLKITAPGGLVSIPVKNFNKELKNHTMSSAPFGGITPSPFINVDKCVSVQKTSLQGYGRPIGVPSITTPDDTIQSNYNNLTVVSGGGGDLTAHTSSKQTPSSFSRANLQVFDIIDNVIENNENILLIHPTNKNRHSGLSDFISLNDNALDPSIVSIENTVMKGRVEEIAPQISASGDSHITIKGRSQLMDLADQRSERDFELSKGMPVKEIGDLGTPTVSMTLGGLGQGGIDIQKSYVENPILKGWKDRIVTSGNPSVRNDKATSTLYASTRSLVELPIFPSMMFDTEHLLKSSVEKGDPLPTDKCTTLTIDCTMTAMNRPQMSEYENRFSKDWGMYKPCASLKVNDASHGQKIRCMKPSVQTVTIAGSAWDTSATDYEIDLRCPTAGFLVGMSVLIGEGGFLAAYPHGISGVITAVPSSSAMTVKAYNPLETTEISTHPYRQALRSGATTSTIYAGIPIVLGDILHVPGMTTNTSGDRDTVRGRLAGSIQSAFGLASTQVQTDKHDTHKIWIHSDGPDMGAFEVDPLENYMPRNDRPLIPDIECRSAALNLIGKSSSGDVRYVMPMDLNLGEIAASKGDFESSFNEIIRRINQAGHPNAKNLAGGSAFDPPYIFTSGYSTSIDTGSHMGYVRAFAGKAVESKSGERGFSIVIHSTVPGAAGRNFAVWIDNKSPNPYRPSRAFGFGGLVATNSRHFKANSFPAPLPLGDDGETYLPITTFTGAVHGSQLFNPDNTVTTYPDVRRRYDGIGSHTVVNTVISPTVKRIGATTMNAAASATHNMIKPLPALFSTGATPPQINHLAIEGKGIDHWYRTFRNMNEYNGDMVGIIRVNDRLAEFRSMTRNPINSNDFGEDCVFLKDITPYKDVGAFYEQFFAEENGGGGSAIATVQEVEVEIILPPKDSQGILFFGGGHTGVVADIADGTGRNYENEYKHYYSKPIVPGDYNTGATIVSGGNPNLPLLEKLGGFVGFQNLGDVSTASAILDFTDIKNEDTLNEASLRGFHHKSELDSAGKLTDLCFLYARLNTTISGSKNQDGTLLVNDLDDSPLWVTTNGTLTAVNGPAYNANKDSGSKGIPIGHGDCVALFDSNNTPAIYTYNGVKNIDTNNFTISAWIKPTGTGASAFFSGPVIHGIKSSSPWGLHIGGSTGGTDLGNIYIGLTYPSGDASNPVNVAFLDTTALNRGKMTYAGGQWIHVVVGLKEGEPICYLGSTGDLYREPGGVPSESNALIDLSEFMKFTKDQHYKGNSPNNDANGFRVNQTGSADHPAVLSNIANGKRQNEMVTIGMALIGAPDIEIDPGTGNFAEGPPPPMDHFGDGVTTSGYFHEIGNVEDTSTRYYGTVASSLTTGANHAGPIHFQGGSLADVAVFKRGLTFAEATTLFTGKGVW